MKVFVTGGTGYIGRPLIGELIRDGHTISALARPGSESKVPPGSKIVPGDALDASTYQDQIAPADVFVHLVGVAHPGPGKKQQFQDIDLRSIRAAVSAASHAQVSHFVYLSVAHPAPMMQDYIAVRMEGERLLRESGIPTTAVRPWYVLGEGHWWPYALLPVYALMERIPSTREGALRLGLVTHAEMVATLRQVVGSAAEGFRVVDVGGIRRMGRS